MDETTQSSVDAQQLALDAQAGCRASFERLFEHFAQPLFDFAMYLCNDPEQAEELTQAAFVRAWRKIALFDPRWRFSSWLFSIASHLHVDARRSRKARYMTLLEDGAEQRVVDPHADPLAAAARKEEQHHLWSLARRVLGHDQWLALWLRYAEDFDASEIARILGKQTIAVRVMLFRARRILEKHLEKPAWTRDTIPVRMPTDVTTTTATARSALAPSAPPLEPASVQPAARIVG